MGPTVRRITSVITIATFSVQATACHAWQPQQDPTPILAPDAHTRQVRAQLSDGTSQILRHPRLEADTLIGFVVAGADTTETRIAWDQVTRIDARKGNAAATAGLVVGTTAVSAVALGALGVLIAMASNY